MSFAPFARPMGGALTYADDSGPNRPPQALTRRQKAAIIVRLLARDGIKAPIDSLPEQLQTGLAEEMALMTSIDRATLDAVLEEFLTSVDDVALSFPRGLEGALGVLDHQLSATARARLRRKAGVHGDPWPRIAGLAADQLLPVLEDESIEVAAVLMSKLGVGRAAELLGKLPGPRARRIAYAVSLTGNVDPDTVQRIGLALAAQLDAQPIRAFEKGPVERVGAILNSSAAATRQSVLEGLEAEDAEFAEQVRKAIFTFANIPRRIDPRDISKIVRALDQSVLVTALAGAKGDEAAAGEFLLKSMSQRLANSIREEVEGKGKVKDKEAEEAMSTIVSIIREMEAAGELFLISVEEEE